MACCSTVVANPPRFLYPFPAMASHSQPLPEIHVQRGLLTYFAEKHPVFLFFILVYVFGMGNGHTKTLILARNTFLQRPRLVGGCKLLCSLRRGHLDAVAYETKSKSLPILRIVEKARPRHRGRSLSCSCLQHCYTCFACRKNSHPHT